MTPCNQNLAPLKLLCDRLYSFLSQIWLSATRQMPPTPLPPTPRGLLIILHPFTNPLRKCLFWYRRAEADQATYNLDQNYRPGDFAGIISSRSPPDRCLSFPDRYASFLPPGYFGIRKLPCPGTAQLYAPDGLRDSPTLLDGVSVRRTKSCLILACV